MQDVKGKLFRNLSGLGLALTLAACVSGTGQPAGAPASPSQQEGASDSGDIPIEEKIFIDGTLPAETTLDPSFHRSGDLVSPPGSEAERVPAVELEEGRVSPDELGVTDYQIIEAEPLPRFEAPMDPIEAKRQELATLQMTRDNLQKQLLIYAGTDRAASIQSEMEETDRKLKAVRQEIQDLEAALTVSQLNQKIQAMESRLASLQDEERMLEAQLLVKANRDTAGEGLRETDERLSQVRYDINQLKAELGRYRHMRDEKMTVEEIDILLEDLNAQLENLRSNENMNRRSIFNLVEHGAGSAEIDRAQARLDETLAKISAVESEISRLENLRRSKQ